MQEPLLRAEDQGGRTVRAYLSEQPTQNAIRVQFTRFLREFEDEHGETVYVGRIKDMITGEDLSCKALAGPLVSRQQFGCEEE